MPFRFGSVLSVDPMIDTNFDFRTDACGKDPDSHSPTLRRYHQMLWSKPLPNGKHFALDASSPGRYLYHRSELGEFVLASDSVIHTYCSWKRCRQISSQLSEVEKAEFLAASYTIGGMMVFPGNRVGGKSTINQERGCNHKICDRMDLTLECVRRHYQHGWSPMVDTLARYSDFFALFGDFGGYVDFFLLQDLVCRSGEEVKFFMPFDNFERSPVPQDLGSYKEYRRLVKELLRARNGRIADWALAK